MHTFFNVTESQRIQRGYKSSVPVLGNLIWEHRMNRIWPLFSSSLYNLTRKQIRKENCNKKENEEKLELRGNFDWFSRGASI